MSDSLLSYYTSNRFNPVPIALDTEAKWQSHFTKRRNLYERHLAIPLSLLRGRSVIEFGCNSGENALVLAAVGAKLSLVEPNPQTWAIIRPLFERFNLARQIVASHNQGVDAFASDERFDLVIAEGFLYTLRNRDAMLRKLCRLVAPGGLLVISFNDRYGGLVELTKRLLLWRACSLEQVGDVHGEASLALARSLFGEQFASLAASRPFEAWWKDMLVCPFFSSPYLWSYLELVALLREEGFAPHATSPRWDTVDSFRWYKAVQAPDDRSRLLIDQWHRSLPYFLTGFSQLDPEPAPPEVAREIASLGDAISEYTDTLASPSALLPCYPRALDQFLGHSRDERMVRFNTDMRAVFQAMAASSSGELLAAYQQAATLQAAWGTPYHYLCGISMGQ